MEKLNVTSSAIYSKGKQIEELLYGLNCPCLFVDGIKREFGNTYYFAFSTPLSAVKILKLIDPLEVLLGINKGALIYQPTTEFNCAQFSLYIANASRESISIKAYKTNLIEHPCEALIGIDITNGEIIYSKLRSTPHLLIAGASGSGKSVLLNNIIKSFSIYNPKQNVGLVLIDTKQVEFEEYRHPKYAKHLACPIATDKLSAIQTLKCLNTEMDKRYSLMREKGIKEYFGTKWVVVIDEFADLMLTHKKIIEPLLVRLAQMGRASGIHLIIATQRPSVDVCTGLIKANMPDRIALKCASIRDSMVILDSKGAENLLGNGDAIIKLNNKTYKAQCFNE